MTLLIGFLDFLSGYELDFFLLYFIPIALVAWFTGRRLAIFIVILSVMSSSLQRYWQRTKHCPGVSGCSNITIQGLSFLIAAFAVWLLIRSILDQQQHLNEELHNNAEKIKLFAYSVSHDLKSPLIGINGLTNLLNKQFRDVLDDKGRRYCDQILKAPQQALTLIDEINLYIQTKETPLDFEIVKAKDILGALRDEFDTTLSKRQSHGGSHNKLLPITADKVSLRIFRNLVENALKYGGEELDEINIQYEQSSDFHIFSIADNGVGVDKEGTKEYSSCSSGGIHQKMWKEQVLDWLLLRRW